jgi:hypothetical protein
MGDNLGTTIVQTLPMSFRYTTKERIKEGNKRIFFRNMLLLPDIRVG